MFGRFLDFSTTVLNSELLPANLTERRFRSYWERTDKTLKHTRFAKGRGVREGPVHYGYTAAYRFPCGNFINENRIDFLITAPVRKIDPK